MAMPKVGHLRASIRGGESRELYVCFLFELKYASTPEHENETTRQARADPTPGTDARRGRARQRHADDPPPAPHAAMHRGARV